MFAWGIVFILCAVATLTGVALLSFTIDLVLHVWTFTASAIARKKRSSTQHFSVSDSPSLASS